MSGFDSTMKINARESEQEFTNIKYISGIRPSHSLFAPQWKVARNGELTLCKGWDLFIEKCKGVFSFLGCIDRTNSKLVRYAFIQILLKSKNSRFLTKENGACIINQATQNIGIIPESSAKNKQQRMTSFAETVDAVIQSLFNPQDNSLQQQANEKVQQLYRSHEHTLKKVFQQPPFLNAHKITSFNPQQLQPQQTGLLESEPQLNPAAPSLAAPAPVESPVVADEVETRNDDSSDTPLSKEGSEDNCFQNPTNDSGDLSQGNSGSHNETQQKPGMNSLADVEQSAPEISTAIIPFDNVEEGLSKPTGAVENGNTTQPSLISDIAKTKKTEKDRSSIASNRSWWKSAAKLAGIALSAFALQSVLRDPVIPNHTDISAPHLPFVADEINAGMTSGVIPLQDLKDTRNSRAVVLWNNPASGFFDNRNWKTITLPLMPHHKDLLIPRQVLRYDFVEAALASRSDPSAVLPEVQVPALQETMPRDGLSLTLPFGQPIALLSTQKTNTSAPLPSATALDPLVQRTTSAVNQKLNLPSFRFHIGFLHPSSQFLNTSPAGSCEQSQETKKQLFSNVTNNSAVNKDLDVKKQSRAVTPYQGPSVASKGSFDKPKATSEDTTSSRTWKYIRDAVIGLASIAFAGLAKLPKAGRQDTDMSKKYWQERRIREQRLWKASPQREGKKIKQRHHRETSRDVTDIPEGLLTGTECQSFAADSQSLDDTATEGAQQFSSRSERFGGVDAPLQSFSDEKIPLQGQGDDEGKQGGLRTEETTEQNQDQGIWFRAGMVNPPESAAAAAAENDWMKVDDVGNEQSLFEIFVIQNGHDQRSAQEAIRRGSQLLEKILGRETRSLPEDDTKASKQLADLMWFFMYAAIKKKVGFDEGTYVIIDPDNIVYKFFNSAPETVAGERLSSHFPGRSRAHIGADLPDVVLPGKKRTIDYALVDSLDKPNSLFYLKPENYGVFLKTGYGFDWFMHGWEFLHAQFVKFRGNGGDDQAGMQKERVPTDLIKTFKQIIEASQSLTALKELEPVDAMQSKEELDAANNSLRDLQEMLNNAPEREAKDYGIAYMIKFMDKLKTLKQSIPKKLLQQALGNKPEESAEESSLAYAWKSINSYNPFSQRIQKNDFSSLDRLIEQFEKQMSRHGNLDHMDVRTGREVIFSIEELKKAIKQIPVDFSLDELHALNNPLFDCDRAKKFVAQIQQECGNISYLDMGNEEQHNRFQKEGQKLACLTRDIPNNPKSKQLVTELVTLVFYHPQEKGQEHKRFRFDKILDEFTTKPNEFLEKLGDGYFRESTTPCQKIAYLTQNMSKDATDIA